MYRLVLCYRYVRSRFLTMVATLAVMLGVGTLIVVMAVMTGFLREVREAARGGLGDVIIQRDITGFTHYDELIERLKAHPNVEEATPVVFLYGLVRIAPRNYGGVLNKPCFILGVRPEELAKVSKFREFLVRQGGDSESRCFEVPRTVRQGLPSSAERLRPGCIPGNELVTYHDPRRADPKDPEDTGSVRLVDIGDEVVLTSLPISARGTVGREGLGGTVVPNMRKYTVVDYYKSRLYEFDNRAIFIPFAEAQILGDMGDPAGQNPDDLPRTHEIRVKLHDYGKARSTIEDMKAMWTEFRLEHRDLLGTMLTFETWEERQADMLSAVNMQLVALIMVIGLIILVAGFLIGAVLTMIVREKTRDIGIMKSLGASDWGVAQIFLAYAASVSGLGALLGLAAAKIFIFYIDTIERFLSRTFGFDVFPRKVYYIDRIPRYEDPWHIATVVVGAVVCAVLCSTVAAWRAAWLQPVEALRYE